MDGTCTECGTHSALHTPRLFAEYPNRNKDWLSVVDFSELPGLLPSSIWRKEACCQVQISQGTKSNVLSALCTNLASIHMALTTKAGPPQASCWDLEALVLSLSAGPSPEGLDQRVELGMDRVAEG